MVSIWNCSYQWCSADRLRFEIVLFFRWHVLLCRQMCKFILLRFIMCSNLQPMHTLSILNTIDFYFQMFTVNTLKFSITLLSIFRLFKNFFSIKHSFCKCIIVLLALFILMSMFDSNIFSSEKIMLHSFLYFKTYFTGTARIWVVFLIFLVILLDFYFWIWL